MSAQDQQLYLSPDQQDLLMAALNSNQPGRDRSHNNPTELFESPPENFEDFNGDDNGYLDFDIDGDYDENYDDDDSPEKNADGSDNLHDKRKSIDGQDDDDEGGGKRREGDDKSSKKPGRKPLTSEPTSVRDSNRSLRSMTDNVTEAQGTESCSATGLP